MCLGVVGLGRGLGCGSWLRGGARGGRGEDTIRLSGDLDIKVSNQAAFKGERVRELADVDVKEGSVQGPWLIAHKVQASRSLVGNEETPSLSLWMSRWLSLRRGKARMSLGLRTRSFSSRSWDYKIPSEQISKCFF